MDNVKPAISYWAIAVMGLIWNLMGCMNYISQSNASAVAQMPEAYQAMIAARPAWAVAGFAVAVFGGAVGCILLLMRRAVAVQVLCASLIGVVVTMAHVLGASGLSVPALLPVAMSLLVGAVLLWVAYAAKKKGWLR